MSPAAGSAVGQSVPSSLHQLVPGKLRFLKSSSAELTGCVSATDSGLRVRAHTLHAKTHATPENLRIQRDDGPSLSLSPFSLPLLSSPLCCRSGDVSRYTGCVWLQELT